MQILSKMSKVILSGFCLLLSFQIVFAQDISTLKADIYSKIGCITCKDMTVDKCNCPKSREMRAYIDALIEMDVPRDELFYKVAKKFTLKAIMDQQIRGAIEKRLLKESGGKTPQAVLETASANLGTVSKRQGKISKVFKLQNQGNAILTINSLKASCPCVTAAVKVGRNKSPYFGTNGPPAGWQAEINPGKSAEIEAVIDLNHRTVSVGKLIREVYISTNDVLNPETTLRIEAEVTE